ALTWRVTLRFTRPTAMLGNVGAAPDLFGGGAAVERFDLGGAEFVFRDLAERIELRVRQHIRRRLGIAERDEHHPRRDRAVAARLQFDRAAPRRDADARAGPDAEPPQFGRREARDRLRLDLVQDAGAPRHRAGVPVFELAAGCQYHRIIVIRLLGGRYD